MSVIARIKLQNILSNYNTVYNIVKSQVLPDVKICVSVKADAYGHGLGEVVAFLSKHTSVDYWGVANIEEALLIRDITEQGNVLCYTQLIEEALERALLKDIELFVGDAMYLSIIEKTIEKLRTNIKNGDKEIVGKIHLMIETGMGRLGFMQDEIDMIYKHCLKSSFVKIMGICSHFSDSSDDDIVKKQLHIFERTIKMLSPEHDILLHIANSGAIIWQSNNTSFNMVRPGIMLYGASPNPKRALPTDVVLYAGMELVGKVGAFRRYKKGQTVSYSSTYICEKDCNIVVVNAGYGDGLMRSMSNTGIVSINHIIYPIVGVVCMDMCMVNMGDDIAQIGDEVVFFGNDDISIEEQAQRADTISYVLSTQITARTKKIY